jgi:hypothetical protein
VNTFDKKLDELQQLARRLDALTDNAEDEFSDMVEDLRVAVPRELITELRPVLELAWRADPSLVEYHLRRLDIDPTVELAAVKHEASGGRAA